MKNFITDLLIAIVAIIGIVLGISAGIDFSESQMDTVKILACITAISVFYCFVVGEITMNNSQMDKLWSVLPIIYAWVIAAKSGFLLRIVIMAVLITIWGARLTMNFAKKGAYSLKFWEGEEDYRWAVLRKNPILGNRFVWALFDFFFISLYQNVLVLLICLPMVACMESSNALGMWDFAATCFTLFFIMYETLADRQQRDFQTTKWNMIGSGKKLEELPAPYCKGFNTEGLWSVSRHPNYLAEQLIWVGIYLFCIGAGVNSVGVVNGTIIGAMLLVLLFLGSSTLAEKISGSKYPEYEEYRKKVNKYFPFSKYE